MEKNKGGRPPKINDTVIKKVCELTAQGWALEKTAEEIKIGYSTITEHLRLNKEFAEKYAQAKHTYAEKVGDSIVALSEKPYNKVDGKIDAGEVAARRLEIETKKWFVCKLLPKTFGDKVDVEASGSLEIIIRDLTKRDKNNE